MYAHLSPWVRLAKPTGYTVIPKEKGRVGVGDGGRGGEGVVRGRVFVGHV